MSATIAEKRARFTELHRGPGCFVMPNPWDVGSTIYLSTLGFKALATTSRGAAFSAGRPDGGLRREEALAHIKTLVAASDLPFNADFENGFADNRDVLAESVRLCVETGVAGLSIEDYSGDPARPFYDFDEAVARVKTARAAIDATGAKVILTARSEIVLHGHEGGLPEALRRLAAFAEAGADALYAPGLRKAEDVAEVVRVAGKLPVNYLASSPALTFKQIEDLGVRRISVGAALARVAWDAFMRAAKEIAEKGVFDAFAPGGSFGELQKLFAKGAK
ncbi:MAG TPA: isocitrate lyase/phosphoenolpyruvate mutase family protein [Roseiarcus sp.]|nr:isocitrate lyase/phosphoenolpyruvate mutase family protein [Roseiarcus sp.]